jgi:hypothetical protein
MQPVELRTEDEVYFSLYVMLLECFTLFCSNCIFCVFSFCMVISCCIQVFVCLVFFWGKRGDILNLVRRRQIINSISIQNFIVIKQYSICLFLNPIVELLLFCLYMSVIPIKYVYTNTVCDNYTNYTNKHVTKST